DRNPHPASRPPDWPPPHGSPPDGSRLGPIAILDKLRPHLILEIRPRSTPPDPHQKVPNPSEHVHAPGRRARLAADHFAENHSIRPLGPRGFQKSIVQAIGIPALGNDTRRSP